MAVALFLRRHFRAVSGAFGVFVHETDSTMEFLLVVKTMYVCAFMQIKEEVAKLLELKKLLDDGQNSGQFVLKCAKVCVDLNLLC